VSFGRSSAATIKASIKPFQARRAAPRLAGLRSVGGEARGLSRAQVGQVANARLTAKRRKRRFIADANVRAMWEKPPRRGSFVNNIHRQRLRHFSYAPHMRQNTRSSHAKKGYSLTGDSKMKFIKLTVASLALLSSAPVFTAAHAASIPTTALKSIRSGGDKSDWMTTLIQENEGIPKPAGDGGCAFTSRRAVDARGHFIGYQTFNACN
jgi:hypothetical protein